MKKTKWQAVCIVCQFLCMFVVPVVLLWAEYGNDVFGSVKFKISFTSIVFILLFLLLTKKVILKSYLEGMQTELATLRGKAVTETDADKIEMLKRQYRKLKYIDLMFRSIMPVIILVGITLLIKALEQQVIKMYGVFGWSTVSFVVGLFFAALEIHLTRLPNEKKEKK